MGKKIAVEQNLTPVKNFLNEKGYDVVNLDKKNNKRFTDYNQFDAIVVTGEDINFLGIENTATNAIVIDASGRTPNEIESEILKRTR